jgi:hypothetical protein
LTLKPASTVLRLRGRALQFQLRNTGDMGL